MVHTHLFIFYAMYCIMNHLILLCLHPPYFIRYKVRVRHCYGWTVGKTPYLFKSASIQNIFKPAYHQQFLFFQISGVVDQIILAHNLWLPWTKSQFSSSEISNNDYITLHCHHQFILILTICIIFQLKIYQWSLLLLMRMTIGCLGNFCTSRKSVSFFK